MEPSGGRAKVPLVTLQLGWAGLGLCILCMDMCVLWQPGHTEMFFMTLKLYRLMYWAV